jgi:hypothetical protein
MQLSGAEAVEATAKIKIAALSDSIVSDETVKSSAENKIGT